MPSGWLDSGLAAGPQGVACDAGCRAFTRYGIVTDDVFVACDVARFPHPLFDYQMLSLAHWGNAVAQAEVAAHNMVSPGPLRRPHLVMPVFWSWTYRRVDRWLRYGRRGALARLARRFGMLGLKRS